MENSTCACGSPALVGEQSLYLDESSALAVWRMAPPFRLLVVEFLENALNQGHVVAIIHLAGGPYGFVVNNIKILPLCLMDVVALCFLSSAFSDKDL